MNGAYVGSAWGSAGVWPVRTAVALPSMCTKTLMASDRSTCSLVTESPSSCSLGLHHTPTDITHTDRHRHTHTDITHTHTAITHTHTHTHTAITQTDTQRQTQTHTHMLSHTHICYQLWFTLMQQTIVPASMTGSAWLCWLDLHHVPLSSIDPGGNYDLCEDECRRPHTDRSSHLDQLWTVAHGASPTTCLGHDWWVNACWHLLLA